MAEGQLVRVQKDLLEEINSCEGGSFSERARHWKLKEVEQTLETVENLTGSDKSLTVEDLKDALDQRLEQIQAENSQQDSGVNNSLTADDVDDIIREAIRDLFPDVMERGRMS